MSAMGTKQSRDEADELNIDKCGERDEEYYAIRTLLFPDVRSEEDWKKILRDSVSTFSCSSVCE